MGKAKILIVEDEGIVQMDIRQRLLNQGYEVVGGAVSGDEAIQKANLLQPDLILMDIKLKGEIDGIQAAELIRKKHLIPIIFLTAYADEATLHRAQVTDAFGYVLKPFEERELAVNIEMALYKHHMELSLRDSETRLRTIFNVASDGMFVLDTTGHFVDGNPAACEIFGYSCKELFNQEFQILFPQEEKKDLFKNQSHIWLEGFEIFEQKMIRKNQDLIWTEITITPLILSGNNFVLATIRDITQRKQSEAALKESEERYMLAAMGANDGLWDWDLATNVIYFSERWKTMVGLNKNEIFNSPSDWYTIIDAEDMEQFKLHLSNHLKGLTEHFEFEHRIKHKDGNLRWVLTRGMAVRDSTGNVYRIAGSQSDITNRKKAEEKLLFDAMHDSLTGLPNRALLMDRLSQVIERRNRKSDYTFGVLFLDLDQFKIVNDSLGHDFGDALLINTARVLESCVRSIDTVARLGGDEFVVLLEDVDKLEEIYQVAERIQETLRTPFIIRGHSIHTSASIGIVLSEQIYEQNGDILRDADIAMYKAKSLGKSRNIIFEPDMYQQAFARLELENDLRQAIKNDEFRLFYQPILSLETDEIFGLEALIRWRHPKRGYILPKGFIHVAEETGLIIQIGEWVLQEACKQLKDWQTRLPLMDNLFVSVNVSGKQLYQTNFIDRVMQIINHVGVKAQNIRFEITESVILENNQDIFSMLEKIKKNGFQLDIDDFGTGYSSLSYIQNFPVTALKIDKSFIENIGAEKNSLDLVNSIIKLAQGLGLETIAEGIETSLQLDQLKEIFCDFGQGFYLSYPVEPEEMETFINRLKLYKSLNNMDELESGEPD